MSVLSAEMEAVLERAVERATEMRHEFLVMEHLLWSLLDDEDTLEIMKSCRVEIEPLQSELIQYLQEEVQALPEELEVNPQPTIGIQRVLQRAAMHVFSSGKEIVHVRNVLVSMFSESDSHAVYFLQTAGATRLSVVRYISHGGTRYLNSGDSKLESDTDVDEQSGGEYSGNEEEGASLSGDPLKDFCTNLNIKAEEGRIDPLIGRSSELERTIQILCRRTKNNPVFVGDAGVGKTALAEGLALKIIDSEVPEVLLNSTVYSLEMAALLAGTRYRGDFEERMKAVIKAITAEKESILFIDEIHTIIGAGAASGGTMDAANLLKPALASGDLRCMGSTTYKEYRQYFEKDSALVRRFQKVEIKEPSQSETFKILQGLKEKYETHHNVKYSNAALKAAAALSARYMNDRRLPDKAIDVIDEAGAAVHLRAQAHNNESSAVRLAVKDIEKVVSRMTGVPVESADKADKTQLKNLERDLNLAVFGQDEAVSIVARTMKMARAGLGPPDRPLGSFLFYGPTGVGKTEVAKQLARTLNVEFLRFDMSEYMESHTVARLIGAPPGYVGYDQGGLLTESINKNPYAVLLLDEIEKAHPDIFNILLQVMDHATLTDSTGKATDFRNIVLIMTSNVGAREMSQTSIGFGGVAEVSSANKSLKSMFSPEFRNRLDGTVAFNQLSRMVMERVVDKFMMELEVQLQAKKITFTLDDAARTWLADKGFDPVMGARPLKRLIQKEVKEPLTDEILFGALQKGGEVQIELSNDKLKFSYE